MIAFTSFTDNSNIGYQGCYADNNNDDLLGDWSDKDDDWTPETCMQECSAQNDEYTYAGVKYTDVSNSLTGVILLTGSQSYACPGLVIHPSAVRICSSNA